jgi:hypothetical protein
MLTISINDPHLFDREDEAVGLDRTTTGELKTKSRTWIYIKVIYSKQIIKNLLSLIPQQLIARKVGYRLASPDASIQQ